MSDWATLPIQRFATDFAAAQVWIARCAERADYHPELATRMMIGVTLKNAVQLLESAFDNLPAEVQREILERQSFLNKGRGEPLKPPQIRKARRGD